MVDNVHYQVAILNAVTGDLAAPLRREIEQAFRDRGLDPADSLRFFIDDDATEMLGNAPQVAVYFGGFGYASSLNTVVEKLRSAGTVVIPVVDSTIGFSSKVPGALHSINGMAVDSVAKLDSLVSLVMENLSLLRLKRRLFLSYRRDESETAALQLYHHLDARWFEPFLDTHSIRQGEVFQEQLWHRMADSDVVVLFYTENLFGSEWVKQEMARANQMGIRVLQLIWPGIARDKRTELFEPFYLQATDFVSPAPFGKESRLTEDALERIGAMVERLRARALGAREALLLRPLCDLANEKKIPFVVRRAGCVDLTPASGETTRVRVGVGVPDATTYYGAVTPTIPPAPAKTYLLFDDGSIATFHRDFLEWFRPLSPVGSLTAASLPDWMSKL